MIFFGEVIHIDHNTDGRKNHKVISLVFFNLQSSLEWWLAKKTALASNSLSLCAPAKMHIGDTQTQLLHY
ncbi:hypothetical protein VNO77_00144 [Canavalia gladiata]|uniref:Uncharacterized protein n=1 Tax=Canavalia gladiata TaxID=3824 RepID=A0AAN9R510_CANGL